MVWLFVDCPLIDLTSVVAEVVSGFFCRDLTLVLTWCITEAVIRRIRCDFHVGLSLCLRVCSSRTLISPASKELTLHISSLVLEAAAARAGRVGGNCDEVSTSTHSPTLKSVSGGNHCEYSCLYIAACR